ncbi:unnamed protein product, partial [marine sediment metagenome]
RPEFALCDENDVVVVEHESWVLEHLFKAPDTWKVRGLPQSIEWERKYDGWIRVKRFYDDFNGTTFTLIYDIYGGRRIKLTVQGNVAPDNYRLVWKASGINRDLLKENKHYVGVYNEGEEAVVFDYSDVYRAFGDVTAVNTSEWATGKKIDLELYVGLVENRLWLDPNFGYETQGTAGYRVLGIGFDIAGSKFTLSEAGSATSITAYNYGSSTSTTKCAIYDSALNLVGETEENSPLLLDWTTYNFSPSVYLTAGDYWLLLWTSAVTDYWLPYDDGTTN